MPYFPPPGGSVLPAGSVDNTALAAMLAARIKGRPLGAGNGPPQDLLGSQVAAILNADPAPGAYPLLATLVGSGSANLIFTLGDTTKYSGYQVEFMNLLPMVTAGFFGFRFSINAGVSWDIAANYLYSGFYADMTSASASGGPTSALGPSTYMPLGIQSDLASGQFSGIADIIVPSVGYTSVAIRTRVYAHTSIHYGFNGMGLWNQPNINGIQIMNSAGGIASGTVRVRGIPK